jgi:glycosyltransferase involved in cell wall biosynthesis
MSKLELDEADLTVIIPCYNSSKTIERAVESIAKQTMRPKEVILIDDASTDQQKDLSCLYQLKDFYKGLLNIHVISLSVNGGPAIARNAGWNISNQPFIAFLDSDDVWLPEKINIQYNWMLLHPEVSVTAHEYLYNKKSKKNQTNFQFINSTRISLNNIYISNRFQTSSVMLKRDLRLRFDTEKRLCEDYQLWIDILLEKYITVLLFIPLGIVYRPIFSNGGISGDIWKMEIAELNIYRNLYKKNKMSLFLFIALSILSFAKFLRRIIITFFYKIKLFK